MPTDTMTAINLLLFGSILVAGLVVIRLVRRHARQAQEAWRTLGKPAMDAAAGQMDALHADLQRVSEALRRDGDAILARVRRDSGGRP